MSDQNLKEWIIGKLKEYKIHYFYYFVRIENLDNIFAEGILSKNTMELSSKNYESFANVEVQAHRNNREVVCSDKNSHNLHDLVPLYFTSKNACTYSQKQDQDKFCFILVSSYILADDGIVYAFSDGNAANQDTRFYWSLNNLDKIDWNLIKSNNWNGVEGGKRKINCECLIYPKIDKKYFYKIIVNTKENMEYVKGIVAKYNMKIEVKSDQDSYFDDYKLFWSN